MTNENEQKKVGRIYKLFNTEKPEVCLIGSTTSSDLRVVRSRFLYEMRNDNGKRRPNTRLREFAATVPVDTWEIEELDRISFSNKFYLRQLEIFYIKKCRPSLNNHHVIPRISCQYCGKILSKRSLKLHVEKACPVRKQDALKETKLYRGK